MRVHSLLSPKYRVGTSLINGLGVFATASFDKGELVAVWGGKVCTSTEIARLATAFPHIERHAVAMHEGYHLTSENLFELDDAERMNHSCDPNVGVRGQVVVLARRDILAGEELTFAYDTTEISGEPFTCRCGSVDCRKTISGSSWRDPLFVEKNREYMSLYILDKIDRTHVPPPRKVFGTIRPKIQAGRGEHNDEARLAAGVAA